MAERKKTGRLLRTLFSARGFLAWVAGLLLAAVCMTGCALADGNGRYAQSGPFGEVSVTLPEGWEAECISLERGDEIDGLYGIWLRKSGTAGRICLSYYRSFGVCGTGLTQEELTLAGDTARVGRYEENPCWSFVRFSGANEGVVAAALIPEEELPAYADAFEVLDTVRFDPDITQGGAYYFTPESEIVEIGLQMSLKEIDAGGAVIVMSQWDAAAPAGELSFGSEFRLEKLEDGEWSLLPVFTEDLVFTAQAFLIPPGGVLEQPCRWQSLCGPLEPGTYRLVKTVRDFRGPGDGKSYEIAACFAWGGQADTNE